MAAGQHVAAVLACHNRREQTLACLESLFEQRLPDGVHVTAVVVDDGSSDGTAAAVVERFPATRVIGADGSLFWAGAMAIGEWAAREDDPDYLLWLNDDVVLNPEALEVLIAVAKTHANAAIVAGPTVDPSSGETTYSGVLRRDRHPMRFDLVIPEGRVTHADTLNGNVVLVPRTAFVALGGIDGSFAHAMADYDYGLRARRLGFDVLVAPLHAASCTRLRSDARRCRPDLPARDQWRELLGPKGLPPRSFLRYLRRHGGPAWQLFFITPYLRFWAEASALRTGRMLRFLARREQAA